MGLALISFHFIESIGRKRDQIGLSIFSIFRFSSGRGIVDSIRKSRIRNPYAQVCMYASILNTYVIYSCIFLCSKNRFVSISGCLYIQTSGACMNGRNRSYRQNLITQRIFKTFLKKSPVYETVYNALPVSGDKKKGYI